MWRLWAIALFFSLWAQGLLAAAESQAGANLLVNPMLRGDADGDGIADGWKYEPGGSRDKLEVAFALEEVAPGRFAQRIICTRFEGGHVMLAQYGVGPIVQGHWYECHLRYRGENLGTAFVGLHDTNGWRQLGLWRSFSPRKRWRELFVRFQANHSAHETTRFQIWFTSTGTLWIADLSLQEIPPPQPGHVIADVGHKNLLPNAGFEALGGWGRANFWTYGWDVAAGQGRRGSHCAAITWRPDAPAETMYFDYYEPIVKPPEDLRLQTIGYIPVKPGATYVLSVYMRASQEGVPAAIGFDGPGLRAEKRVRLTREWQRYYVTAKAAGDLTLVSLGPIFTAADRAAFAGCVTYIDDAQLEIGETPIEAEARPLEIVLRPFWEFCAQPVPVEIKTQADVIAARPGKGVLAINLRGFADELIMRRSQPVALQSGRNTVPLRLPVPGPGFYRLQLRVQMAESSAEAETRGAVCLRRPWRPAGDSPFGINHAYAYNGQLALAKVLGILWVRDWSLKWEHVEPEQGRFTFEAADAQINRPLQLGLRVLCMFPFPSSEWASTAPLELRKTGYPGTRIRQAYAPKDPADLQRYVAACVQRYKDRVHYWECFNESIFTNYSLPRSAGYQPEDYVPLLQRVYAGCKSADSQAHVIGGYSAMPHETLLYQALCEHGGLAYCDELSVHWYPGEAPEGVANDLERLRTLMRAHGALKPMWMTEYAYYADDDIEPISHSWPNFIGSEWIQAVYNTRACVLMLAHGVEKIFYHIWTAALNHDFGTAIFFEYAGAPHKIAPAQAALYYMLGEKPRVLLPEASLGEDGHIVLFGAPEALAVAGSGQTFVAVIWAEGEAGALRPLRDARYFDICGRPLTGNRIPLGEAPIYIVLKASNPAKACLSLQNSLIEEKH